MTRIAATFAMAREEVTASIVDDEWLENTAKKWIEANVPDDCDYGIVVRHELRG